MVDATRDQDAKDHPRLLDLVPGRSGPVLKTWLDAQGTAFISGIALAAIDPFAGYKSALDATLDDDAVLVLDAFHVVALGTKALDEVRRRVQQATTGHRGRKGDPLHGIAKVLRTGVENLKDSHWRRIRKAIDADPAHEEVFIAWQAIHDLRAAYQADDPAEGKKIATKILQIFSTCPIPEIARLGRTLKRWKDAFLAYSRHESGQQWPYRGAQRAHRTPPTPRPRIQKPRELPTQNAPGLRRPHPQQTPMSHLTGRVERHRSITGLRVATQLHLPDAR